MDVHKETIAVGVTEGERGGKVRYFGTVANEDDAVKKLVKRLATPGTTLSFCYEAGPCGYGLHRFLMKLGQMYIVIAPSMMPRRPGDHVKTDRRDAMTLARLLRAGELTAIWVPDEAHEAVRDLIRARRSAHPLRQSQAVDGLCRLGAVRAFQRCPDQAWSDHARG